MEKGIKKEDDEDEFNFDFDFNFDDEQEDEEDEELEFGEPMQPATSNCIVTKLHSKDRYYFNISNEIKQLDCIVKKLPSTNEVYKMISIKGGFSSIGIIAFVSKFEVIEQMIVSTFRIGYRQCDVLNDLFKKAKLKDVCIITSDTQFRTDTKYNYYNYIKRVFDSNNWKMSFHNNHSKIILMRTNLGNYYVVETSSNLNENPKMEQFSFENDKQLFEFYSSILLNL